MNKNRRPSGHVEDIRSRDLHQVGAVPQLKGKARKEAELANTAPQFVPEHRARLQQLGLLPTQIVELEATLPLNRAMLERPAPMDAVRGEIETFRKAISKALAIIDGKVDARNEAAWRIEEAGFELGYRHDDLRRALAAAGAAETALPKEQRRVHADIRPIARIVKALMDGFIKTHTPPFPPYEMKVSSSPGSDFREIVGICYVAIGQHNSDPERAIKAYIRLKEDRNRCYEARQRKKEEEHQFILGREVG